MSKPVFESLFSFSGRRNRKSYILASLSLFAISAVSFFILFAIGAAGLFIISVPLIILMTVLVVVISLALLSQRCRDFGWTG